MADFTHLLRPKSFDEVVGQTHLVSKDAPFRKLCESGTLSHTFLYGPPGSGKTTLARLIATINDAPFYEFNATSVKIDALRKVFDAHKNALQKPLVFIDEVHRLSKNQQEVMLPIMEQNIAIIIGASTENPFFSLTAAMRSRSLLFELKAISHEALDALLQRAITYDTLHVEVDAREYLVASSGGDARAMLKLLEFASAVSKDIDMELLSSLRPNALSAGSSEAGVHYDLASALIKSIRGSDADAAIYYLARLIEGGESADFIARRLVILASEDIGNANPSALMHATSALMAVKNIGYPEARIILAQAVIYLAISPKSNASYKAINSAQKAIKEGIMLDIPPYLKDKTTRSKEATYLYPHDFGGWVAQEYLSEPLEFVHFSENGQEKRMKSYYDELKAMRGSAQ